MPAPARSSLSTLVFAWCGAALFAFSLAYFLYSYLVTFGSVPNAAPLVRSVTVDLLLFGLFALPHSIFARPLVKARLQQAVPEAVERSLYTWTSSLLFIAVCAWWQPVPGQLYQLPPSAVWLGYSMQFVGIVVTARSAARLDVLDLAGVRLALMRVTPTHAEADAHVPLETHGLYGIVRHPIYLGWVLFVFGTPHMTATRLVFAVVSTAYLAIAIPFEERSLLRTFGESYRAYQQQVRWRMLPGLY